MKKLNLSTLNSTELNQLKSEIEKELSDRSSRLEAIDELRKLAESKGLKLDDLISELGGKGVKARRELGPAPIRFRHPQNSALTWSGRGKRPNWMKDALAAGLTEDQMKV
jgi:DNA-binding protein H-NS